MFKSYKFLRYFLIIVIVFNISICQYTPSASNDSINQLIPAIIGYNSQGEIVALCSATPLYSETYGQILVTSSVLIGDDIQTYKMHASSSYDYYLNGMSTEGQEVILIAYDNSLGIAIFSANECTNFNFAFPVSSLSELSTNTQVGQVLYDGEIDSLTLTTNIYTGNDGSFYTLQNSFENYMPGSPVLNTSDASAIGVMISDSTGYHFLDMDNIVLFIDACFSSTTNPEEAPSTTTTDTTDTTETVDTPPSGSTQNQDNTSVNIFSDFWGVVVLIIAIVLIILLVSLKKDKNDDTDLDESESEKIPSLLICLSGHHQGAEFPLSDTFFLGRDTSRCNIVFPEDYKQISSIHCKIQMVNGRVEITDLGSSNGTFLKNGTKLKPHVPHQLNINDCFYLVNESYLYKII